MISVGHMTGKPFLRSVRAWFAGGALLCLSVTGVVRAGESVAMEAVQPIKDRWATVFYGPPDAGQKQALEAFLAPSEALIRRYPKSAEPLIFKALVLCSLAGAEGGFGALRRVSQARETLLRALDLDPLAMEGSAYVILGNLYYRLPGWPLSFGDDEVAHRYLEIAARYFPDNLDTNYFLGDFYLEQGEFDRALTYLEKAEKASVRPLSQLSDLKLKAELPRELADARHKNKDRTGFFNRFLSTLK